MSVTLDVPEELLADVFHVPTPEVPRQVRIELACALYARGAMTHAQSATLAGLDRFEMGEELGAELDARRHWWDHKWADWIPDPTWRDVALPAGWDALV